MKLKTEQLLAQAARTRDMRDVLRSLLDGRCSRADVAAWTRTQWSEARRRVEPFVGHGPAHVVFESIWNIEEARAGEPVERIDDVRAYVEWLERGVPGPRSITSLVALQKPIAELGDALSVTPVRSWLDGIGWEESVVFASPATGRLFLAHACLRSTRTTSTGRSLPAWSDSTRLAPRCYGASWKRDRRQRRAVVSRWTRSLARGLEGQSFAHSGRPAFVRITRTCSIGARRPRSR